MCLYAVKRCGTRQKRNKSSARRADLDEDIGGAQLMDGSALANQRLVLGHCGPTRDASGARNSIAITSDRVCATVGRHGEKDGGGEK